MKRAFLLLLFAFCLALPMWAWTRYTTAVQQRDSSAQSLIHARANVTELLRAASDRGAVLDAIPESHIVEAVNKATLDAGLELSTIRELTVRIENARSPAGPSSVQRTQLSISDLRPGALGQLLGYIGERLPTAVPTSIRLNHAVSRNVSDQNRFDTIVTLEQVVLSGSIGGSNR